MILIIMQNSEITTNEVIRWLIVMNKRFIRIHEDELFEIKTYQKRIYLESDKNKFFLDEISGLWHRRGGLKFKRTKYAHPEINHYMNETQFWIEDYVLKIQSQPSGWFCQQQNFLS